MSEKTERVPERRVFPRGTLIFREGEPGLEAYLVLSGAVRIFKMVAGRRITIGTVRPHQIFGELALLDEGVRMAAAAADEDTTCLVLRKDTIRDMLDVAPPGLANIIQSLIATMRVMGEDLAAARARLQEIDSGR